MVLKAINSVIGVLGCLRRLGGVAGYAIAVERVSGGAKSCS
ncbi:hypothetical protein ACVXHB_05295 [Escherichia coli]